MIKSRVMRRARHVARVRDRGGSQRVSVGRPERKRPLGRPRRRSKIDLQDLGWVHTDWINVTQDRDMWPARVNAVMYLRVL